MPKVRRQFEIFELGQSFGGENAQSSRRCYAGQDSKEMMKATRRTGLREKVLDGKLTMNEDSVKKKAKLAAEAHD